MPRGFTKQYSIEQGGCGAADSDSRPCSAGNRLLHVPDYCGAGDYSDMPYFYCTRHANIHAREFHHAAETVPGFRSSNANGHLLITCNRCGPHSSAKATVVEGTVASDADWDAALKMVLHHNELHAARPGDFDGSWMFSGR